MKEQLRSEASSYARSWNTYVEQVFPGINDVAERRFEWPGDEWGESKHWAHVFDVLFRPAGVTDWRRAVEIGPGSGKYTLKVLSASQAIVRGYDVSQKFIEVCEQRCADAVSRRRLSLHALGLAPDQMLRDLEEVGWRGTTDAVFSIDAMVHVDFQFLTAYLITAALVLKPEGTLILTLADATTELGFLKLLKDVSIEYPRQDRPHESSKFAWLSPQLVWQTLERLGFRITALGRDRHDRDLLVIASLADPHKALGFEKYLTSTEPHDVSGGDDASRNVGFRGLLRRLAGPRLATLL